MFPYVLCYTCGRDIGSIWALFDAMRRDRLADKYPNVKNMAQIPTSLDMDIEVGDILDTVGLPRDSICCRTRLLSQQLFRDVY